MSLAPQLKRTRFTLLLGSLSLPLSTQASEEPSLQQLARRTMSQEIKGRFKRLLDCCLLPSGALLSSKFRTRCRCMADI